MCETDVAIFTGRSGTEKPSETFGSSGEMTREKIGRSFKKSKNYIDKFLS